MKEKVLSVSGDSFDVKLASGQLLLKVHGSRISLSGRKKVDGVHGKHLFDIVKEHLHLLTAFAIEDAHGKKIAEVKSSLALLGSKATATFTDSRGKAVILKMKGGWFDHTAHIVDEKSSRTVARIDRKLLSGLWEATFGNESENLIFCRVASIGFEFVLVHTHGEG